MATLDSAPPVRMAKSLAGSRGSGRDGVTIAIVSPRQTTSSWLLASSPPVSVR